VKYNEEEMMQDNSIMNYVVLNNWVHYITIGAIAGLIPTIFKNLGIFSLLALFIGGVVTATKSSNYLLELNINKYRTKEVQINTYKIMIKCIIINTMHLIASFLYVCCIWWGYRAIDNYTSNILNELMSLWVVKMIIPSYALYIVRVITMASKARMKYEIIEDEAK